MKNIQVVIGANFGDEGKGLMTHYFASRMNNALVVRFNSSAQAGHTVVTKDGKRHVFGHFGSGTFDHVPTYLSKFFVVNPMLFIKEFYNIVDLGVTPRVLLDKNSFVSTPYDMLINEIVEHSRGSNRHGSCGVGFNETIQRSTSRPELAIRVKDIENHSAYSTSVLESKLYAIRQQYVDKRLEQLGVTNIPEVYAKALDSKGVILHYIDDAYDMIDHCQQVTDGSCINQYESVIFEGAQGLMLDEDYKYFPHVTRSHTGIRNVTKILEDIQMESEPINITYVTRTYMTRHGAGPFPTETPNKPYEGIIDETNMPNEFQGTLRFGLLDINDLANNIKNDLKDAAEYNYHVELAITCIDQCNGCFDYYRNGELIHTEREGEFIEDIKKLVGVGKIYCSYGPRAEDDKGCKE